MLSGLSFKVHVETARRASTTFVVLAIDTQHKETTDSTDWTQLSSTTPSGRCTPAGWNELPTVDPSGAPPEYTKNI
jgi:hypothetical protein